MQFMIVQCTINFQPMKHIHQYYSMLQTIGYLKQTCRGEARTKFRGLKFRREGFALNLAPFSNSSRCFNSSKFIWGAEPVRYIPHLNTPMHTTLSNISG